MEDSVSIDYIRVN